MAPDIDELLKEYDKKPAANADSSDIDHLLTLYPDTAPPVAPRSQMAPPPTGYAGVPSVDEYGRAMQTLPTIPEAPDTPPKIATVRGMREALEPERGYVRTPIPLLPLAWRETYPGSGVIDPNSGMSGLKFDPGAALAPIVSPALDLLEGTGFANSMGGQNAPLAGKVSPQATALMFGTMMGNPNPLQSRSGLMNPARGPLTGGDIQLGPPDARLPSPGDLRAAPLPLEFKSNPLTMDARTAVTEQTPFPSAPSTQTGIPTTSPAPIKTEPPVVGKSDVIPNDLTPQQIEEFRNIPEALPPMKGEIKTQADAAKRADEIINHFASIGNKEPIPGAVGSLPTITGNSGLATLYRTVRSSDTPVPFTTLENAAKERAGGVLSDLVQTPEALKAGEAAVDAKTAPMRDAVFANKTSADPTPVVQRIDEIIASPSGMSDAVVGALKKVRDKLVDKDGNILDRAKDPEQLYGLDKAIRKDISPLAAGTTSDARLAAHELMNVQDALRPVINDAAPGFNDYMRTYSEMQRPLDEMRYLQSRNLTNMMDETTLAKVNGMLKDIEKQRNAPGIKLPDSLSPETMEKLRVLHDQMQRENLTMTAGKDLGSNTFQHLATNTVAGKIAGHVGNALVSTGAGMAIDLAAGGGGYGGALTGAAASGVLKGYAAKQAAKATAQQEVGHQMLMRELRDRLLNIDNKGVTALRGSAGS
jgi:hypothetical protein